MDLRLWACLISKNCISNLVKYGNIILYIMREQGHKIKIPDTFKNVYGLEKCYKQMSYYLKWSMWMWTWKGSNLNVNLKITNEHPVELVLTSRNNI